MATLCRHLLMLLFCLNFYRCRNCRARMIGVDLFSLSKVTVGDRALA